MSQKKNHKSLWAERKERQTGLEVDEYGYPVVNVVFHDNQPDSVIIEPIPSTLENPKWSFKQKQWIEG